MLPFKFELGQPVKDRVTEFEGIVMARTEHLTSCNVYGVSPRKLNKEGKKPDWEWFDEPRLESGKGKCVALVENPEKKTGGPHSRDEFPDHN